MKTQIIRRDNCPRSQPKGHGFSNARRPVSLAGRVHQARTWQYAAPP